jgi:2-amino-4-hydroxy-6-hydroxymethyldihydropteridine diphosphokinase
VTGEAVYLGVGANLGNRKANIEYAARSLSSVFESFTRSSLYETLPMYREDQPRFLNCVFAGCVDGRNAATDPFHLLDIIREIERDAGRDREKAGPMGPRPIDIDILVYGERVVQTDTLTIPHPRMKERPFVLIPLVELAPDLRDPATGELYADLAAELSREGIYHYAE